MTFDESAVRARLEAQRDELAARIDRLQTEERTETGSGGSVAGTTDNAQAWENAEIREGQLSEALDELRQTESALARMDRGQFGVCRVCGNEIEAERLELLPETVHCAAHA